MNPHIHIDDDMINVINSVSNSRNMRPRFATTSASSPPNANESGQHQSFERFMAESRAFMAFRDLARDRNRFMGLSGPFNSSQLQGVLRHVALEDFSSSRPFDTTAPRSFASNLNVANAGQSAATALEIVDSDEEEGDMVEVMTS